MKLCHSRTPPLFCSSGVTADHLLSFLAIQILTKNTGKQSRGRREKMENIQTNRLKPLNQNSPVTSLPSLKTRG